MKRFTHVFRILLACLVVLAFSTLTVTGVLALAGEGEAEIEIQEAETVLSSAFAAVLEAEKNGADVSGLLAGLDSGGSFLAEAQVHYRNGDFEGAVYYAGLVVESVEGLVEEAGQLNALAIAEFEERRFLTVTGSTVAIVGIVLGSVLGWSLFKRRYLEKVLMMKPEVVERES